MDLRDLFRPSWPLTPRYVLSLIAALPIGSAFNAARRGGSEFRDWDETRYALASIANSLRVIQYMYLVAHLDPDKGPKPQDPEPFPIPDKVDAKPVKKTGSFASIAGSMIAATRKRKKEAQAQCQKTAE